VLLSVGSPLFVIWIVAAADGARSYAVFADMLASPLGLALSFMWTFSLFFHLCNGVRHLVWDAGYGFELRTIYTSGWVVLAMSMLLTVIAWIAGLRLGA
ncbi:MAG TPA: succinate dehydrogenase, cytochrome b556 subunit, partial [Steroidobacter sp.]|nr:succinate dehydrogenase, cytochrome b556 subunit [Steroidobacter sp.]